MAARHPSPIRAALAVISRRGRCLICQRHADSFLGGYWEFPGGKRQANESWQRCLKRELLEELGVTVKALKPLRMIRYDYGNSPIVFKVFQCQIARGHPKPLAAKTLRWVSWHQLPEYVFPPANRQLISQLSKRLSIRRRRAIISPSKGGQAS